MDSSKKDDFYMSTDSTPVSEKETFLFTEDVDETPSESQPQETWGNRLEFLLALIGFTVGIGSIWRFPITCIRNGGITFLVPLGLILLLFGGPIYYLEINLGQFTGKSVTKSFEFCPLFRGIGYLELTMSVVVVWYYIIILAWVLYFFFNSFVSPLPWAVCDNQWNTPHCSLGIKTSFNMTNETQADLYNNTLNETSHPAVEFWKYNVLNQSEGLESMGSIQLHLAGCLFLAWLMSVLGVIKGVKSLGKIVYVTALFPYVLLTILFIRGITLDGAGDGLAYFFKFEIHRLAMYQTWFDAAIQVFYSLGPIWGPVITMSSHNKFNQPSLKDTVIICLTDIFTAVYATLIVFAVIGFMSKESGTPIEEIATASDLTKSDWKGASFRIFQGGKELIRIDITHIHIQVMPIWKAGVRKPRNVGPGLAFVAYPTAITMMPIPRLWAVLFFLTLMLLFLDSNFGMVETLTAALTDEFPSTLGRHRVIVHLVFGMMMFLASLVFATSGGAYLVQLIDWYCSAFGLLIGACFEVSCISLVYGIDRFSADITMMTGRVMSKFSRFLYCIFIPISTLITFMLVISKLNEPTYGDSYVYKPYAIIIGFVFGLLPVFNFCVCLVVTLVQEEGSFIQRVKRSLRPSKHWGPKDPKAAMLYEQNPYVYESTWTARLRNNLLGSTETSLF